MVDLKEIRKILEAETEEDEKEKEFIAGDPDNESYNDAIMAGFVTPVAGWKTELNDFYVAAPLSIGTGILMALAFDYVRSKGNEGAQIFEGPWKTMAILTGSLMFGFGAGKLSRGIVAQAETQFQEAKLKEAETKVQEAEEEKEAEQEKQNTNAFHMLTDPAGFQLAPSKSSLNIFGEYGATVGQAPLSYQYNR